jgi:hypothetical protein
LGFRQVPGRRRVVTRRSRRGGHRTRLSGRPRSCRRARLACG